MLSISQENLKTVAELEVKQRVSAMEEVSIIVLPCVRHTFLGNGFSDFIVILQEYVLAYEDGSHQVWLLGPTGNRVMALCYFQIYIVDRYTFCLDAYLGNGFSDFIIPSRRFRGGYCFGVVYPSFRPAGRLWTTESWPKAHCEVTCLLPLKKWESCQLLAKIWGKHWLWHPDRSLKEWLPLKWPKNC